MPSQVNGSLIKAMGSDDILNKVTITVASLSLASVLEHK